jgi:hypothetical protein
VFFSNSPLKWKISRLFILSGFIGGALFLQNLFMFVMGISAGAGGSVGEHCGQSSDDYTDQEWCLHDHPNASPDQCTTVYDGAYTKGTEKCTGDLNILFGDSDHGVLQYDQLKTLMFLSVSLSVFFSAFCARTEGPFYTRRPSLLLLVVFGTSALVLTIFTLFCDEMGVGDQLMDLDAKTVFFVWGYCASWFLFTVKFKIARVFVSSLNLCSSAGSHCKGLRPSPYIHSLCRQRRYAARGAFATQKAAHCSVRCLGCWSYRS